MLEQGTKHFDLYNFFSVLLPGLVLVLGLLPLMPDNLELDDLGVIIALGITGFVIGRILHTTAVTLESRYGPGHRKVFKHELKYSESVSDEMVDEFWKGMEKITGQSNRGNLKNIDLYNLFADPFDELYQISNPNEISDKQYNSVYVLVRSLIHMDGRGRSRTFQSIYAFNRSMVLVMIILLVIYSFLFVIVVLDINVPIGYSPYIQAVILPDEGVEGITLQMLLSVLYIIGWAVISSFNTARKDFKKYFAQYLIADFVILSKELQE